MLIALSGTPGVGKTTVSTILASRGHDVLELSTIIEDAGALGDYDPGRDTYEVDLDSLQSYVHQACEGRDVILVGHLSHLIAVSLIIVLRCRPSVLRRRMTSRGWSERKIMENLEAEACDVILVESLETSADVCEVDTTSLEPSMVADAIEDIIRGERDKYAPGNIDWSEEVLGWF